MSQASATAALQEPEAPSETIAGRYRLLEQLGAGGMGSVHRAIDQVTGRTLAFKQLNSSLAGKKQKSLEALFEREYHTLLRLKHPRIIEVFDYGLSESGPYYTMELLDGQDLHQLSPLPYKDACRHLRDVASSLALIHANRLVHRDVSPRNVRLTPDGRAKLIDFGALTAFGPVTDVVGTPVCMAPEVLRRSPLDQRADLFALGAVAYYALTGQHAYPARRFDELAAVWQRAPLPPSDFATDIPHALDSLVLSLLSLDPMERPTSAAAVIDQLTAIAELPSEDQDHAAESYLSSGRMIGRKGEEAWVQKRVARALNGKGGEVVIEGSAGVGKTRLLHEVGVLAQLKGVVLLKADAEATPGFLGVATTLALNLLITCPELARRALGAQAPLLAHLSPELKDALDQHELQKLNVDQNERRARFQTALFEWFGAVSSERPLMLVVDNIHAADDGSAAFLAALGSRARESKLLILVSQRIGDEVVAKAALQALRKRCSRLKLANLSPIGCEELVTSLFGDVANTGRVARVLYDKSSGNPQLCSDLAQLLVKKKIARYLAGTWVLPLEVMADELPNRVDELLAQKVDALSLRARGLAEALSVHRRPVPIELCLAAGADGDEKTALAALDELVLEQILLTQSDSYRFTQDAVREALLAQMDETRRKAAHLRAAESLLASSELANKMEAGWHFLSSGEEGRGADLLAQTSREFLKTEGANESVDHIVHALRTAVEVFERLGRSEYQIAGLLFPLVPLSYFSSDWRIVQRYAEAAFRLGLQITGLSLAQRLHFVLGRKLALKIGLAVAGWRFAREKKKHGLELGLEQAIGGLCGMVPATFGAFATTLDQAATARVFALIAPLRLFTENFFASLMHQWGKGVELNSRGLTWEYRLEWNKLILSMRDPQTRDALGEGHFRSMFGGALFTFGVAGTYQSLERALEPASEMETLGVRTWAMAADQIRMLAHAYRGEIEEVRRYRARVELFAVQGTATWQAELFVPAVLLNADVLTGDTIAARRTWEQLARRARNVPSIEPYADAARAAYLTLRGALPEAIATFEKVLPHFPLRGRVMWLAIRAYFAQALNLAREHARAKALLTEALAQLDPNDDALVLSLEARRQLALAEAGLKHPEVAIMMLETLLAKHGDHDNPLLVGLLHKARAEIALGSGDKPSFEKHLQQMEQRFLGTQNPALVAQCKQLGEAAARSGLRAPEPRGARTEAPPWMNRTRTGHRSLAELTAAPDRAEYSLWLLLEQARAKSGYLYLFENNNWRLGAASTPAEPPPGLETQLRARCEHSQIESQVEEEAGTLVEIATSGRLGDLSSARKSSSAPARRGQLDDDIATKYEPVVSAAPASRATGSSPDEPVDKTVFIDSVPAAAPDENVYRMVVLSAPRDGQRLVVGGVILELGAHDLFRLSPELLDRVAIALHDRCVTSIAYSTRSS